MLSTRATSTPIKIAPLTNQAARGMLTKAITTKPSAIRTPANSESTRINFHGPGCLPASCAFMTPIILPKHPERELRWRYGLEQFLFPARIDPYAEPLPALLSSPPALRGCGLVCRRPSELHWQMEAQHTTI